MIQVTYTLHTGLESLKLFHFNVKSVQVGNDQEMALSERNSNSINRGAGKN